MNQTLTCAVWHPNRYHTIGDERMAFNRIARRLQYDEDAMLEVMGDSIIGQSWLDAWRASVESGNAENVSPTPRAVYQRMLDSVPDTPEMEDIIYILRRYLGMIN